MVFDLRRIPFFDKGDIEDRVIEDQLNAKY